MTSPAKPGVSSSTTGEASSGNGLECGGVGESAPYDYDDDHGECANCGGEGFTYGCSWDWQCDTYDEGEGTCLCTRRCEWCNPLTPQEKAARQKLRDVLATALAKDKVAEMRSPTLTNGGLFND